MIEQAEDFLEETRALHRLLAPLKDDDYHRPTQFKGWTLDDVIRHLHFFNIVADLALSDEAASVGLYRRLEDLRNAGISNNDATSEMLDGLHGTALLARWQDFAAGMAGHYQAADPKQRLKWVGPDMSARSMVSARLMETWAHGQSIYDLLGVVRSNADRIKSIAVIGVNTYEWTFRNRGEVPPEPIPHLILTAPSGETWTWNTASEKHRITGPAEDFCQVVTQVRHVADTRLRVSGSSAARWMAVAQCFAGPVRTPPEAGTRGPDAPAWEPYR